LVFPVVSLLDFFSCPGFHLCCIPVNYSGEFSGFLTCRPDILCHPLRGYRFIGFLFDLLSGLAERFSP
jgi:hypothetical protein